MPLEAPPIITAYSTCNGLGRTTAEVVENLAASRRGLGPCPIDVPFETVCGFVPGDLPAPPDEFAAWDTRILRIGLHGFAEVAEPVAAAVERWGADRVALVLATSTGGIAATEAAYFHWLESGALPAGYDYPKQHPFHAFTQPLKAVAGIDGLALLISTACSSSAKVLSSARRLMQSGVADAVLVGGVDSLADTTVRGFNSLGVLSKIPCRPFGADRPGMNVGEGASYLLLEREGTGSARLLGVGETSDAFHMSSPDPEGRGAAMAMKLALEQGGLTPADVSYVNAHGTGTKHNDTAEAVAVHTLLGDDVPVASTKGYTGHMLGAAGATEAVFGIVAIEQGWIPQSVGAEPPDPDVSINLAQQRIDREVRYVLSNSFAFGGNNTSVLLGGAS